MSIYNKANYPFLYNTATALYEKSRNDNLRDFPLSVREEFHKTGIRQNFEKLYFKRRDYLSSTAVLALFDDSYINELEKIIVGICEEALWALPAHTVGNEADDRGVIDLFVAETSFALAEICTVFADKISLQVCNKVKTEIRTRLLENYKVNTFWWEKCNMNWASVCAAYTAGTLLYLFPQEFEKQKKRILKTLEAYIDGFTQDGFCPEGPLYWQYGFFAYSVFADLLHKISEGKTDLFAGEKVRRIASFSSICILKGNTSLSFSDSQRDFLPDFALMKYLSAGLNGCIPYAETDTPYFWDANTKWMNYYRAIIWDTGTETAKKERPYSFFSENADVLIVNKSEYSFAFKAGNNDEPHNHNDLGSFIYSDKDGQVFCDLGAGRYTKDYFDDEKRYDIFCNSSFSHSVPIINRKGQSAGKEYKAKLSFEKNTAVCDLSKAYCLNGLTCFIRKADLKENGVLITDKFVLDGSLPITERFVSLRKAEIKKGVLIFASTKMFFPEEKVSLSVKEEKHTPHEYDMEDITVYCYDFTLKKGVNEITFEITTE